MVCIRGAYAALMGLLVLSAASAQVPHSLDAYLRRAHENNPSLRAAAARVEATQSDIRLALTFPDPKVSAGYFISEVETRVGPQKGKVGVSQMIPWPGKLAARRAAARYELDAAREKLRMAEASVFAELRAAYAQLYSLGREIAINHENLALLKHMESVLLARYATTTTGQVPVLKLQVEMAVTEDAVAGFEAKAATVRESIRALVNDTGAGAPIPYPTELPRLEVASDAAQLGSEARKANAALRASEALALVARAGVGTARQGFGPDLMLMTDYMFTDTSPSPMVSPSENGKDPWVIGASLTVPLWIGSKATKVRKAQAMERMGAAMAEDVRNTVDANAVRLFEDHADAKRRVALYEQTLVPKAHQALEVVEEAYANGSATVLDFLDAQRMLLKLRVALAKQKARRETIAGKIDALLGGDLTRKMLDHE
jgi:cobalt-zinc-cadmium efflux system outer membrane protein